MARNDAEGQAGRTPLHVAAQANSIHSLAHLIENGANTRLVDDRGWTILETDIYYLNCEGTEDLLKSGTWEVCEPSRAMEVLAFVAKYANTEALHTLSSVAERFLPESDKTAAVLQNALDIAEWRKHGNEEGKDFDPLCRLRSYEYPSEWFMAFLELAKKILRLALERERESKSTDKGCSDIVSEDEDQQANVSDEEEVWEDAQEIRISSS